MAQTHTDYISKYYKLSNNFDNASTPVTTMMGDLNHPFIGYFDGNNRILAVNIIGPQATDGASDTSAQGAAPFRKILGATIENLTVQGYVGGQGYYAAGLVGICSGNCTIKNCTVQTQVSGADYVGGIVGYCGDYSQLTLNTCVSAGYISSFATYAGGLVGWYGAMDLFTCNNCLFKGSFSPNGNGQYHPVILANSGSSVTANLTETYYLYQWASTVDEHSNHIVAHADGFPVSDTCVQGKWDNPVKAADGKTYYMKASGVDIVDVTIGELEDAESNNYLPMYSLYNYSYTQQIYTANEIGQAGTITDITMWLYGNEQLPEMSFDIYLVETDKEAFESNSDWVTVTADDLVYSGTVTVHNTTAEEYTFKLDTPFEYRGEGNLVVCFNNKTGEWKSGLKGLVFTAADGVLRSLIARQDNNPFDPTNLTFETNIDPTAARNVIRFGVISSGIIVPKPKTLVASDVTARNATLTWTGGTGKFNVEYKKEADEEWTRLLTGTTDYSCTLVSLDDNTTYQARVQSVDLINSSASGWKTVSFTTDVAVHVPTNLTVNYTGGTTAVVSWTSDEPRFDLLVNHILIENAPNPYTLENLNYDMEYVIQVCAKNDQGFSEWTDEVSFFTDLSDDMCYISLDLTDSYGDGWNGNAIQVYGVTYERSFGEFTIPSGNAAHYDVKVPHGETLQFIWKKGNYGEECSWVITEAFGEEIYSMEKGGAKNLENGTVFATFIVDCVESEWKRPTNLTISEIGPRSAMLNWTENGDATEWIISVNTGGIEVSQHLTSTKPYNINNLNPETEYTVKVKPNADDGTEKWSQELTFTTLVAAPLPTNLTITEIGPNTATATWQGFANSYDVRYTVLPEGTVFSWLQYDDGTHMTSYGSSSEGTFTWGVMYPAEQILGDCLTKVSIFESADYNTNPITINIYSGGDDAPGTLLYTEEVTPQAADAFHEVTLNQPVDITPGQNLWITLTETGTYVMACCESTEPNNQWIYYGGSGTWNNMAELVSNDVGWMIRAGIEKADFDDETIAWTTGATNNKLYDMTDLEPETIYVVQIRSDYGEDKSKWATTSFTTLEINPVPFNLTAESTHKSATLRWAGFGDRYNVKYRTGTNISAYFVDDFESGLDNWTVYQVGEAGSNGAWYTVAPLNVLSFKAHSGTYVASAWSWNSYTYNADNWLVTPQVTFGHLLTFWVRTNTLYPDSYEVLLSTGSNAIADFTVTLQEMAPAPATDKWEEVTIDLSAYAGQTGHIAIHHVSEDMNFLLIDDFSIYDATSPGPWQDITVTKTSATLNGLTAGTNYEYQIQSVLGSKTSEWSPIATFTTLDAPVIPTGITDVTVNVNDGHWYSIDGKRLNEQPKAKGIYIHNGHKVVIKGAK